MCNVAGVFFAVKTMTREEVEGRRVLEVGSLDVNGSLRPLIESWSPAAYVGVDIAAGPGVDRICRVERLAAELGAGSFDLVISTELLEHVRDWRAAISNLKQVVKPGGTLFITTRSRGFGYHAYPHDYWRYELDDLRAIFADCEILRLERDPQSPGVFMKARKPPRFLETDLAAYELFSIVVNRRARELRGRDFQNPGYLRLKLREEAKRLLGRLGRLVLPAPD